MTVIIHCKVNGIPRAYYVKDTGMPYALVKPEDCGESKEVGGLYVHRADQHYHHSKGNGWCGQFRDMPTVMEYIRCLRGTEVSVEEVEK